MVTRTFLKFWAHFCHFYSDLPFSVPGPAVFGVVMFYVSVMCVLHHRDVIRCNYVARRSSIVLPMRSSMTSFLLMTASLLRKACLRLMITSPSLLLRRRKLRQVGRCDIFRCRRTNNQQRKLGIQKFNLKVSCNEITKICICSLLFLR